MLPAQYALYIPDYFFLLKWYLKYIMKYFFFKLLYDLLSSQPDPRIKLR